MGVQAYITAGQTIIPVLLPDAVMQDTARQIGIPEADLFSVDVPVVAFVETGGFEGFAAFDDGDEIGG